MSGYRGRFAPSPTGPLHAGSLVAALASWLDARAHRGDWLVRIEDVDRPRCLPGADAEILRQLARCGLLPDAPAQWQSQREPLYQDALDRLVAQGKAYPCGCSRKDVELALRSLGRARPRHGDLVYPGTCRSGLHGKEPRAWRFQVSEGTVAWTDRRTGVHLQNVAKEVGDFVLKRADGLFAYQLAVVVDDAEQGITHVVRGEDLVDNTPRQLLLQRALGYSQPAYLHAPLVLGANGEKLSKQNGAAALDLGDPRAAIAAACAVLEIPVAPQASLGDMLAQAVVAWGERWP
jgi:glutamyl-Q tRNA(Asp) synthetase